MIADGLRRRDRRNRKFDLAPVGRAASGVAKPPQRDPADALLIRGEGERERETREANPSVVYAAYLRRRSIRPLNRRVRLMEFAVQGNNFLGRGIRSRSMPFAAVRVSLTPAEAKLDSTVQPRRLYGKTVVSSAQLRGARTAWPRTL